VANVSRPDLNAAGYPGDHGFNFQIPSQYRDGRTHLLYAYGIDTAGGTNPMLSGSPMQFNLQPSDSTPPTVSITASANGATVSSIIDVTANASDNVGVARVELYVDGALRGVNIFNPYPYTFNLDTLQLADGSYTLLVKAYDYAGNVGQNSISVSVWNGGSTRAIKMEPIGLPETVFDWSIHSCEDNDIPDLPARAFRVKRSVSGNGNKVFLSVHLFHQILPRVLNA
jgi:hypothetical protein